jgi:hypothetical protein
MELRTKSKRPGMDCYTDVYFDQCEGFSEHINDPVAMILNEKSNLNIVQEETE